MLDCDPATTRSTASGDTRFCSRLFLKIEPYSAFRDRKAKRSPNLRRI